MGHKAQMNVKHVGNINALRRGIDAYLRDLPTSHRANHSTINKFSPSRTSNPDVAAQWEARVAQLHANTKIFHKAARKTRKFDPQERAKMLEMAYYFNKYGAPF